MSSWAADRVAHPDRIRGQVGGFGVSVLDEDVVLAPRHG